MARRKKIECDICGEKFYSRGIKIHLRKCGKTPFEGELNAEKVKTIDAEVERDMLEFKLHIIDFIINSNRDE